MSRLLRAPFTAYSCLLQVDAHAPVYHFAASVCLGVEDGNAWGYAKAVRHDEGDLPILLQMCIASGSSLIHDV